MCGGKKLYRKTYKYASEIIQIGAVLLDEGFNRIATMCEYVNPEYGVLDNFIESMTGIKNRDIKQAPQQSFDLNTLQSYEGFNNHLFFDLGQYVEKSCTDQGLIDAFNEQLEKAFPTAYRLHTDQFYSVYNGRLNPVDYYTGVTVSEPSKNSKAPLNTSTAWYQATH